MKLKDQEVYVWAALNTDTFEVIHVDVGGGAEWFSCTILLKLK